MTPVECVRDHKDLRIFIDGLLHFHMPMAEYSALQSFQEGGAGRHKEYSIEVHMKSGSVVLLEYDQKPLWESVLKAFNQHL